MRDPGRLPQLVDSVVCWLVKEALTTPLEPAVRLELTYLHSIKNGLIPGIRLHYPYMLY